MKKMMRVAGIVTAIFLSAEMAHAQYTWTPTAAGNYSWNADPSNWTSGFPNAVGDIANLNINLVGNQTINLNQAITIGTLNLGDTGSSYFTTTIAPNGGSLIMDAASGSALISKATTGNDKFDTISAGIQLNDNLIVDNAATSANGAVVISGAITQSGGDRSLTKNGAGTLTLSTGNSYAGGTILNAGTLRADHATALGTGSLTINGGTLRVGATFSNNNVIIANSSFTIAGVDTASTGSGQFRIAAPITISGGADNAAGASLGVIIGGVITDASGGNTLNAFDVSFNNSGTTSGITLDGAITLRDNQTLRVNIPATTSGMTIRGAIGDGVNSYGATFGLIAGGSMGSYTPGSRGAAIFLGGTNTYDGNTTINSGVNLVLGLANSSTTGSLNASSTIVNNGNFFLRRSDTITQGTHFGAISGAGNVIQTSGTATLTGTNTYTGSTTLQGGTLVVGTNAALGSGWMTFNGGTLRLATGSTLNISRPVVMTGNGTVDTSLAAGTISGVISGTGNLTKTSANNLTLSGVNTFTGNTVVSGGKVVMGNAQALQFSAYDTTGSTGAIGLDLNGNTTPILGGLAGGVNLATAVTGYGSVTALTLNPQSGKSVTYTGVIGDGAGGMILTKTGAGTQTISSTAVNTFTGGLRVNAGTLALTYGGLGTPTDLINNANTLTMGGGTLTLTGKNSAASAQTLGNMTLNAGASGITVTGGTSSTMSLTLGNTWTRNAGATINVLLGTGGSVTSSPTLSNGIIGPWASFGSGTSSRYATVSGGNIAGLTGTAAADGAGLTDTTGTVNYDLAAGGGTVPATMSANTIRYGGGTGTTAPGATLFSANGLMNAGTGVWTIGTGAVTIGGSQELVVNTANNGITISGAIGNNAGGASSLTKTGSGTLTLSSANTYSGGTTLNAGTLTPTNAAALGSGTLTINGGGITIGNSLTLSGAIPIVMNGDWSARTANSGQTLNTGTGAITLNAPIIIDVSNSILTLGGTITGPNSANALDIAIKRSDTQNAAVNFTQGIVLRGNQVANLVPSGSYPSITYSGAISDGGNGYGMTFSSPTTYNLDGGATFTGPITINSGSAVRIAPGFSVASTAITINSGATLQLGNQNLGGSAATIPTGATLTNNGTFRLGDNTAYTQGTHFPNGISGTGSVEVRGTRATGVTFSGTNTYSGGTTVIYTGGGGPVVFNINSANAIGTGPLTLSQSGSNYATINNTSGGAITLATNNAQNWNGPFAFTGTNNLNLGTGTVLLANNPTVEVSANTLTVGGTVVGSGQTLSKAGAGTLALNGATTLGNMNIGNATTGGSLVVGSGGTLSVGSGTGNSITVGNATGGSSGSSGSGTLDVSASTGFTANVGNFIVGDSSRGQGGGGSNGSVLLGALNNITATSIFIGRSTVNNPTGGAATLTTAASGNTTINTGSLNIAAGPSAVASSFTLGSGAAMTLQGASGTGTRATLAIGSNTLAWGSGGGSMNLSGGQASLYLNQLVVGKTTSTGDVASSTLTLGTSASNHLNVSATSGNAVQIGYSSSANNATGTVTIGNLNATSAIATSDATAAAILIGFQNSSGIATGTLNLNGGTLKITTGGGAAIAGGGLSSTLNLDGGAKLVAGSGHSDWINGMGNATIGSGGATIDTNGNDIGFSQSFSGDGGLIKDGIGTLTVSTSQDYTGTTTIQAGELELTATGSLAGGLTVGASGTLDGAGTIDGDLYFANGGKLVFNATSTLLVNGASISFGGFSIASLVGLDEFVVEDSYTLIDGTATIDWANVTNVGVASAVSIGGGKSAYFEAGSLMLTVIPEPATFGIVLSVLAAAIIRRRRFG